MFGEVSLGSGPVVYLEDNSGGFSVSENYINSISLGKRDHVSACGFQVEPKRFKFSDHGQNQQQQGERLVNTSMRMINRTPPLGLSLRKTPSFLELIQSKLNQERNSVAPIKTKTVNESSKRRRGRPRKEEQKSKAEEKLKANSWNAKLLKIGSWERRAVHDQDLVAKCYYQQQKLVWEMLDGKLKKKMEIQWSDITAIRAAFPANSYAVLEIEVKTVPLFFQETTPQPRKQSGWVASSDFTGVQATLFTIHHLQFEQGILEPYYEKLLQCDKRLFMLSKQPFPFYRAAPYFHPNMSVCQNCPPAELYSHHQPSIEFPRYGIKHPSYSPCHQAQTYQQRVHPSNPTYIASPLITHAEDHGQIYNVDPQRTLFRGGTTIWENYYVANEYQPKPLVVQQPVSFQCSSSSSRIGNGLPRPASTNSLLKDIANQLLNVPISSPCLDEEKLMARVNSMCNLLELSQEQAPINNYTDTSDYECSQSSNNSTLSGSGPQESENWLSTMGVNDNSFKHQERIPSLSDIVEALEAGGVNEMHQERIPSFSDIFEALEAGSPMA